MRIALKEDKSSPALWFNQVAKSGTLDENGEISVKSVLIRLSKNSEGFEDVKDASVSWSYQDENLGSMLLSKIQNIGK